MKAKVLSTFLDKENKVIRKPDEIFEISEERAKQIIDKNNNLIEIIEFKKDEVKPEFPKHIGGGLWLLSNGEKIKGKEDALKAEEALKINEENKEEHKEVEE